MKYFEPYFWWEEWESCRHEMWSRYEHHSLSNLSFVVITARLITTRLKNNQSASQRSIGPFLSVLADFLAQKWSIPLYLPSSRAVHMCKGQIRAETAAELGAYTVTVLAPGASISVTHDRTY